MCLSSDYKQVIKRVADQLEDNSSFNFWRLAQVILKEKHGKLACDDRCVQLYKQNYHKNKTKRNIKRDNI